MSDSEDPIDPVEADEEGDDLFGDENGEERASPKEQFFDDDEELASDPDEDSRPRHRNGFDDDADGVQETRDRVVMAVPTYRHRVPKPKDGALRVLRVPKFVKFHPELYDTESFEASEYDIANARADQPNHVARVARDSSGDLKSNVNMLRWSDGSVTMSIGGEQHEIQKKSLAPLPGQPYTELKDGHYYAAAAELKSNLFITVGHIAEQYTVRPNAAVVDETLEILAQKLQSARGGKRDNEMFIKTTRDPELAKKEAEMAEKERLKAQRRRDNAAAKLEGGLGRAGRGGGLSIGDLEGGRRMASNSRRKGMSGAGRAKRRRAEYDSDDDLPQGVGRHENYDLDDGFLVGSEDEEEMESAEEDEEELLDDDEEEARPKAKRQRTQEPEDQDAEGSEVEAPAETAGRVRRRNVVDDDDED